MGKVLSEFFNLVEMYFSWLGPSSVSSCAPSGRRDVQPEQAPARVVHGDVLHALWGHAGGGNDIIFLDGEEELLPMLVTFEYYLVHWSREFECI